MKGLDIRLAPMLALVLGVGCQGPPQDRAEPGAVEQRTTGANDGAHWAANAFVSEARNALDDLGVQFDDLETRYADLQGDSASVWALAREEIVQAGDQIEADLDSLGILAAERADEIRSRIARNIESLTHRVERAELLATDGSDEFVAAARERLEEIDRDIQELQSEATRLPMEARGAASQSLETLRSEANDVRETVTSIAEASPQLIAELRDEVAEDVASLWASVRREAFELRADLVG